MNLTNLPTTDLFQHVMMASPNGALVLQAIRAADGRLIDLYMTLINSVAERELDCPAVEALGQSFTQFFPHLAEKSLLEKYRQVLDTGKSTSFEHKYVSAGKIRPVWLQVSVIRLEKSLLLAYNDITETKADAKRDSLTDLLQQAFDESVNGISVFEAVHDEQGKAGDFKLAMINKAGLAMSGFLADELIGRTVWEMYPSTNINGLFSQYVQVYETGQPVSVVNYYPEYDIWRDVKITRVEQGIMVTYNDITALKKAEARGKQQEQLLADVLESMPVGMAVVKPVRTEKGANYRIVDFRVVKANSALERMFGQSASQVVDQLVSNAVHDTSALALLGRCLAGVDQGKAQVFDMPMSSRNKSGLYRISVMASAEQLILTFTDITVRNH